MVLSVYSYQFNSKDMKFRSLLLFVILFSPLVLKSQAPDTGLNTGDLSFTRKQPKIGFQMGSSFTTGYTGKGIFSNSIAPHVHFQPRKNFTFVAGSVFSTSSFSGNFIPATSNRLMSTTLYASGAFQFSSKLILTGGVWGEKNNLNNVIYSPQMNPNAFNLNAGGMMMGFEYKINESMSFGAEVNFSRSNNLFNPYMNQNPFSNTYRRFP
jgi:hypothetical protein